MTLKVNIGGLNGDTLAHALAAVLVDDTDAGTQMHAPATYTIAASASVAFTLPLPPADGAKGPVRVVNLSGVTVTIAADGADNIISGGASAGSATVTALTAAWFYPLFNGSVWLWVRM